MPSANTPASSAASSALARPWPPLGGVIRKMVWIAAVDLVRQFVALGVELISGRRRAARSALGAMASGSCATSGFPTHRRQYATGIFRKPKHR